MDYLYGKLNGAPTINEIAKDIDNIKSDIKELQESYEELNNSLNSKLGKDDLIAGTNIEITDEEGKKVISCTAEGAVYTGGNGINISNENVISVDTEILEPYVTQTELNLQLDDYALKTEIPDVPVQDVTVDGTSVLNDGVAAITLPTVPITGIEVNGTTISPTEGVINITVPTIPANVSAFNNDAGYITNSALTPYVQASSLATVATTGDYNDLINKPTIPVTDVQVDGSSVLDGTIAKITMPTFTQQQADWNQTDDTVVDFIKNKPNLNVYVNKNTDLVKDLTYDIIEKEIPGEIVDGETYELPMEYDMSKFDLPSETEPPLVLYGDLEHIPFILIYSQGIDYNDDENGYSYMDIGDGYHWYIMGEEPVLYEGEPLSITIDESKINEDEKDILSIVLGIQPTIITVNQTVEDKINEELKDKTYDYVTSNIPVDGHTYKLKENANINSLLLDEGTFLNLVLYQNASYRIEYIKSSSKRGSTEYKLNVYDSNDEIIDIYMIALGAGGEYYVNQWQNGTEVLTLDFLYNEQNVNPLYKDYFNQFLNVQESSSRSLKQKFDEVENEINAPLKDKLYEKGEKYYQPLFTPSIQTLDLIWDAGGSPSNPHLVYEDNNLIIETYTNSYSQQIFQYYRFIIGNDIYLGSTDFSGYWQHTDADSNVEQINSQEDLPKITFDKQYITSGDEELFNGLIYSKNSTVTLGQKLGSFKDWTYEDHPAILVDGEDYPLLNTYSDDFFTKYEDLFVGGGGTTIYTTGGMGQELDLVNFEAGEGLTFKLIVFQDINTNPSTCVAYTKVPEGLMGINDGWYLAEWSEELNGWSLVTPPTTTTNPTLTQLNNNFIIPDMEDVLKDILGVVGSVTTVDDKFNEPLKDKTYELETHELVNGESYNFEEHFTLDSNENRDIYTDSEAQTSGLVSYINVYNNHLWVDVVPEPGTISSPFGYNLLTNEWEDDSYQYLPQFIFNSSAVISDEESLKIILGLNKKTTLEQKFDKVEPPYTITDYTEDNGALTSITVKDKTDGTETQLTIGGGGKQLYKHCIAIKDTTPIRCYLTIINDNNTPFTSKMLYDFLIDNNMTNDTKSYEATGVYQTNVIHSLCAYNNQIYFNWGTAGNDKSYSSLTNAITDTVITL